MFVSPDELSALNHRCLIIDVSCDPGMGFPFSRTTTFERPTYDVDQITVCAVDHTPAYHWDAATWCISKALIPHVPSVAAGREHWHKYKIINDAIEISHGMILNKKIISYQNRSDTYPFIRQ